MEAVYTLWLTAGAAAIRYSGTGWTGMQADYGGSVCPNKVITSANWVIQRSVISGTGIATSSNAVVSTSASQPPYNSPPSNYAYGASVSGQNATIIDTFPATAAQIADLMSGQYPSWTFGTQYSNDGVNPTVEILSVCIQATFTFPDNMSLPTNASPAVCTNSGSSTVTPGTIQPTYLGIGHSNIWPYISAPSTLNAVDGHQFNAFYWTADAYNYPQTPQYDPSGAANGTNLGPFSSFIKQVVNAVIPPFTFKADGITPYSPYFGIPGYASDRFSDYTTNGANSHPPGTAYDPFNSQTQAYWQALYVNSCVFGYVDALPPTLYTVTGTYTDANGVPLQRQRLQLSYQTPRAQGGAAIVLYTRTDCSGNFIFPAISDFITEAQIAPDSNDTLLTGGSCTITITPANITGTYGTPNVKGGNGVALQDGTGPDTIPPVMPSSALTFAMVQSSYLVKIAYLFSLAGQDSAHRWYLALNQPGVFNSLCGGAAETVTTDNTGFGILKTIDPNVISNVSYTGFQPQISDFTNTAELIPLGYDPYGGGLVNWQLGSQYTLSPPLRLYDNIYNACVLTLFYANPHNLNGGMGA